MRYTIEGFSQTEAVKFRRTEIVNGKEKTVALDCTDLVILRWFVDFYPNMMKVEVGGHQYAWINYQALIEDMPLLGIKKGMLAIRLKKLVSFGILKHRTVKNGGTFSYYGFGSEYARLVDTNHTQQVGDPTQNISEGVRNKLETPTQNISDQIDSSTKDPSTKDNQEREHTQKPKGRFQKPTLEEVTAYCQERRNDIDPQYFMDYQEARGWRLKGGQVMKDWKATIRTWERMGSRFQSQSQPKRQAQDIDLSDFEESRKSWTEYTPEEIKR